MQKRILKQIAGSFSLNFPEIRSKKMTGKFAYAMIKKTFSNN